MAGDSALSAGGLTSLPPRPLHRAAPKQVIPGSKVEATDLYDHHFYSVLLVTQVSPHVTHLGGNCITVQIPGGRGHGLYGRLATTLPLRESRGPGQLSLLYVPGTRFAM